MMPQPTSLPPPCDVIIVLGAAVWPGEQPSPALRWRTAHAVHLLRAGRGRMLLDSGGLGKHPPAEASLMQQLALEAGVPAACVLVEDQATSTFQSAIYCTRILHQHDWSTALVVTDRYHLPRALLTFRSLGIQVLGSAPPRSRYSRRRWKRWYYPIREILAYIWYILLIVRLKVQHLGHASCLTHHS
ncbi:MAG TPA: YdcF family protein [Candidatus Tectomicrobia bacterium]